MKRTLKVIVNVNKSTPEIYAEGSTFVEIGDEGGGEFIIVSQTDDTWNGKLAFDKDEWEEVKKVVDKMFKTLTVVESQTSPITDNGFSDRLRDAISDAYESGICLGK